MEEGKFKYFVASSEKVLKLIFFSFHSLVYSMSWLKHEKVRVKKNPDPPEETIRNYTGAPQVHMLAMWDCSFLGNFPRIFKIATKY